MGRRKSTTVTPSTAEPLTEFEQEWLNKNTAATIPVPEPPVLDGLESPRNDRDTERHNVRMAIIGALGRKPKPTKPPEFEKWWTTLYYGPRGSGKSLHQAKMLWRTLEYLDWLYYRNPELHQAIVYSVQKFSPEIEKKYLGRTLYYWTDAKDLRYCPRTNCWKKGKHRLHGCYLVFDDVATILPADNWQNTPIWLRKLFAQARHFGIRTVANLQDPESVDINFRRYTDMAYKFKKWIGSRDPDETKPPIKRVWGVYVRWRIKAEWLWRFGDMTEDQIMLMREKNKAAAKAAGGFNFFKDIWKSSAHWISRRVTSIYDTTQDVPEYKPSGYAHTELRCVDPRHNHEDKKAPNYCGFKKVSHEIV